MVFWTRSVETSGGDCGEPPTAERKERSMALARRTWIRILGLVLGVPILFIGLAIVSLMIISAWSVVRDGPRAKLA